MSQLRNAYPELPEVPYAETSIAEADVIAYLETIKDQYPLGALRVAFALFFNESADGKKGVNGNYEGVQADGDRLPKPWDSLVTATVLQRENMTGNPRRFCVFDSPYSGFNYLVDAVYMRSLFIGGYCTTYCNLHIVDETTLARAYYKTWVMGDANAEPKPGDIDDFISIYNKSVLKIN